MNPTEHDPRTFTGWIEPPTAIRPPLADGTGRPERLRHIHID